MYNLIDLEEHAENPLMARMFQDNENEASNKIPQ